MSFRSMLPTLLLAFALSIFVCVLAAARGSTVTLALAAGLFAVQVLFALLRINVPLWRAPANPAADFEWAWSNTMLTAFAYAWGATAMFAIYSLTGLAWRHWWQYGAIMALLALATLWFARQLANGRDRQAQARSLNILLVMTGLQLAAVVIALAYLVSSGKLATEKADWAANVVFLAGGLTVAAISLASLHTYRRRRALEPTRA
jgi:hypothetical protein